MITADPFEVLRAELRAQPVPDPELSAGELVDRIVRGEIAAPDLPGRRRGRRRAIGGGLAAVVLVGGGLAAAGVLRQGSVTQPQAGVACRADASLTADAVVLGPQDDPVAACRELWVAGELGAGAPELAACINPQGAVEVLPVADAVADAGVGAGAGGDPCAVLDLAPLGTADPVADPLVLLQDAVVEEVNATCVARTDAVERLEDVLARLGLEGWRIAERPGASGPCARVAVEPEARTLHIDAGPPPGTG